MATVSVPLKVSVPLIAFHVPVMFAVFVVSHSLVPHKEERFMVPMLPILLVGLVPLAAWILDHGARWRAALFATVNLSLLVLVIGSPPQRGLFLPAAFITRPVAARSATADQRLGCGGRLVVLTLSDRGAAVAADSAWRRVAHFEPGSIERLIVRLNPSKNARRGPVDVFAPAGC